VDREFRSPGGDRRRLPDWFHQIVTDYRVKVKGNSARSPAPAIGRRKRQEAIYSAALFG
jgi:hypothetical protein